MAVTSSRRRRLSIRTKWAGVLLITGAVPLAVFVYLSLSILRSGLETEERGLQVATIDHVASVVDRTLESAAEATHRVGRLLTEPRIAEGEARLELAREAMARADAIARVAIYQPDGALIDAIARSEGDTGPPPPARLDGALIEAVGDGSWIAPEYVAGEAVLRYLEPVNRDGARRALVMATLAKGALRRQLEGISRDRFEGRADGVLLLDGAVRVMAGGGAGPLAVGQPLAGKDLLSRTALPEGVFRRPFAVSSEFVSHEGEAMVGSARSLPGHGWAVVVRRPTARAYQALGAARQATIVVGALFLIAAVLVGAWLAARTTRPIRQLMVLADAFGRREFSRPSPVRTGDELEGLGDSLTKMAQQLAASETEIKRRATVEANLARYLPGDLAGEISSGRRSLALGGERRRISVLFADVVSFTSFAEKAPAEKVVAFLNELFTVLTEVVFRHGGTVDKFIGDCVMAMFGGIGDQPDHAARALAAAEDMHRFVEANAPAWRARYDMEARLGIGVSTGEALVGNLGSEARMEFTAIGDSVNVAARLEGLARPGQTLVTAAVVAEVGEAFSFSSLGEHPLRGKKEAIEILELA